MRLFNNKCYRPAANDRIVLPHKIKIMKAAVVYRKGEIPQYADIAEPVIQNENEVLISVKAAAIKHLDKSRASGKHYSSDDNQTATVIGGDGVGVLEDGTRVFALGSRGMIAEKAVVEKDRIILLPSGIDDAVAAALPNAVAGSAMALQFRACLKQGETVLINGATGFTGKIAVQVARYYGVGRIIVTGRIEDTLTSLLTLGADEIVSLQQDDESLLTTVKAIHNATPIDVVIDYLWGHTAELILASLKGNGTYRNKTRFVSVGAMSGDSIELSSEILRSVDLQISGSGLGSWTHDEMKILFRKMIPDMLQRAADGELIAEVEKVKLKDIESLWDREVPGGKRLVVVIE